MEITAEVHFAQRLACNQGKVSENALKKLENGLPRNLCITMEEKADVISKYIHVFKMVDYSFLYIDTFFQTMAREWLAIDRYRLEKFMMLVRKFLQESYQLLKNLKWELKWIKRFRKVVCKTVISNSDATPDGLKMHISDIYMEELAKAGANELTSEMTQLFLIPFCRVLIKTDNYIYLDSISKDVFLYLINQSVDEELFHEFPVLNFDADAVQNLLMKYASKKSVKKSNMRVIYGIVKEYEDYKGGVCATDKIFSDISKGPKLRKRDIEKAALNLYNDEVSYSEEKKRVKKKKIQEDVIDL